MISRALNTSDPLVAFVRESNKIEGIIREPTDNEVRQTQMFLDLKRITVADVVDLVAIYQPDARPRFVQGLNVRVGSHIAPAGGPEIQRRLVSLLENKDKVRDAYELHVEYEILHPFTDGNGRSGRVVWLWHMLRSGPRAEDMALGLGFLHSFYYQALQHAR